MSHWLEGDGIFISHAAPFPLGGSYLQSHTLISMCGKMERTLKLFFPASCSSRNSFHSSPDRCSHSICVYPEAPSLPAEAPHAACTSAMLLVGDAPLPSALTVPSPSQGTYCTCSRSLVWLSLLRSRRAGACPFLLTRTGSLEIISVYLLNE